MSGYLTTFLVLSLLLSAVAILLSDLAAERLGKFLVPTGRGSFQRDFSFEKSLVMQGRTDEALESYEALIRAHPETSDAYVEAAELNVANGSPERAVELFRRVRQLEKLSDSQRMYATNRLIDLYLGKSLVADATRAKSELRYLIAHFPGTQAATTAKTLIAELS